jgi:hypothetical protein
LQTSHDKNRFSSFTTHSSSGFGGGRSGVSRSYRAGGGYLVKDVDIVEALQIGLEEIKNVPLEQWKVIGDKVYAEGKWTLKDILRHLIDTERIFSYRAMCIARGETVKLPFFDEADYAKNANAGYRSLEELVNELLNVRISFIDLYKSFTSDMLLKTGLSFNGTYSVLAIGFIMAGHPRWHFRIIEERYLPLSLVEI